MVFVNFVIFEFVFLLMVVACRAGETGSDDRSCHCGISTLGRLLITVVWSLRLAEASQVASCQVSKQSGCCLRAQHKCFQ